MCDVEIVFDKKQQQVLCSKQKPSKQTADIKPNTNTNLTEIFSKDFKSVVSGNGSHATKKQIHSAIKAYSRLGATPLCLNLVICPYCKIALFGEHQYQEHLVRFHPESHYLLCKQTAAAAAAAAAQQSKQVTQQITTALPINQIFCENDFTKKLADSIQSKSVQNDRLQHITNDDQMSKQGGSKQTAGTTQNADETIKRSVCCATYKFKLFKLDVPNELRSNYRQWKTPAYKVYSYQKYPTPKINTFNQELVENVNKQLPASEKGTSSITVSLNLLKKCNFREVAHCLAQSLKPV